MMNTRGIPTAQCLVCGSNLITIVAVFDQETYEIDTYMLDACCYTCGALLTAPTPLDSFREIQDDFDD